MYMPPRAVQFHSTLLGVEIAKDAKKMRLDTRAHNAKPLPRQNVNVQRACLSGEKVRAAHMAQKTALLSRHFLGLGLRTPKSGKKGALYI